MCLNLFLDLDGYADDRQKQSTSIFMTANRLNHIA